MDIPQFSTPQDFLCTAGNDGNGVKTPGRCETHDERSHVPGVRFMVENHEGWTPVVKGSEKKSTADNGDGSRCNPVRSKDEILKLDYAKEVKYVQRNGTPGLTFRRGKKNHSYQWIPIGCVHFSSN